MLDVKKIREGRKKVYLINKYANIYANIFLKNKENNSY